MSIAAKAQDLVERGRSSEAVVLLRQAARDGVAEAARQLAIWTLSGRWIPRDLVASRALFARAGALGDPRGAAIHRAFLANGTGGDPDWGGAIALLREAEPVDAEAADQLRLIEAMGLTPDGCPRAVGTAIPLSSDPEIAHIAGFLSADECAYLMTASDPFLQPSVIVDPRSGQLVPHPIRTSRGASFPLMDENPAIHAINRRIAAATASDVRAGEPLQVLRYDLGQQYSPHLDALPAVVREQQRVLTFLVYLNDDFDGGETDFPQLRLRFKGRAGDAVMFRNATPDGQADPRVLHAGLPVRRGAKYLASRWIRAAPIVLK